MTWGWIVYWVVAVLLWLFLTVMAVWSLFPGLARWLAARPRAQVFLLGINQMPDEPEKTLRRFYLYLDIGWTWLLLWSWWLMPWLKTWFYRGVASEKAYQLARVSTLVVLVAYSAFGFFCIGRAISLWFRRIYARNGARA